MDVDVDVDEDEDGDGDEDELSAKCGGVSRMKRGAAGLVGGGVGVVGRVLPMSGSGCMRVVVLAFPSKCLATTVNTPLNRIPYRLRHLYCPAIKQYSSSQRNG